MAVSKAVIALLEELHGELAQSMLDELQAYKQNPEAGIPGSMLNVIAAFLKQNGKLAGRGNESVNRLREMFDGLDLPFDGTKPDEYEN